MHTIYSINKNNNQMTLKNDKFKQRFYILYLTFTFTIRLTQGSYK